MPRLSRRLLPPLALACLAASTLLQPAGLVVAQEVGPEPLLELDVQCKRLTVQFLLPGWTMSGTCEYRLCWFVDEDGYMWTLGGAPITWFEGECGPLGTHAPSDDTPEAW